MKFAILEDLGISDQSLNALQAALEHQIGQKIEWIPAEAFKSEMNIEGIVSIKTKLSAAELNAFPGLKWIAVAFTGYDAVDLDYCRENKIAVFNVPAYSSSSVAELTIASAINLLRQIPQLSSGMREGEWHSKTGFELRGKTVGIWGTGKIGVEVAKLFNAFGAQVLGYSRTENPEFLKYGTYVQLAADFLSPLDLLTVHVPLNEKTNGLIDAEILSLMKEGSYLINTARGPIVNEEALLEALSSGKLQGAALDVFDVEPLPEAHPFRDEERIILTPHIAYNTQEALQRRAEVTFENIGSFYGQTFENRVA